MAPSPLPLLPLCQHCQRRRCPYLGQSFLLSNQEPSYKAGSVCTHLFPLLLSILHCCSLGKLGGKNSKGKNSALTLEKGVAGAWVGTMNPKLTLSKVWRPILTKLPSYPIREILMNTWTSLISSLPNYLTNCQEPEAWACYPDVSLFFFAWAGPIPLPLSSPLLL